MNKWTKGLLASAISGMAGGVINAFAAIGISPESFNLKPGLGFHHVLYITAVGAAASGVIFVAGYLQKSPLPQ
ncbi:Uncharacterised protein [uncultured archaeon]|nr:Uncharacterised protein [uncultured archaeon]